MQLKPYQALEANFKKVLKSNSPKREDFTCAVCLSILHEPTTLESCHHTFCRSCVQHMYCGHCHRYRTKTINRISENLFLLLKPSPAVYCTCQSIDSVTGELTVRNQRESFCPLCRTAFKPEQCTVDIALEKFISLYFPKGKSNEDDQDQDQDGKEEEKRKKKEKERKRSTEVFRINDESTTRRRSQESKQKFYAKAQRWSTKWAQPDSNIVSVPDVQHDLPSTSSRVIKNDMLLLARRSWIF